MDSAVRIGFSTSDGLLSAAIRAGAGGPASHAFLHYWDERFEGSLVLGEDSGGWRLQTENRFIREGNIVVGLYEFPEVDLTVGLKANVDLLGGSYDWAGLLGMAEIEVARLFGVHLKSNPTHETGTFFCSAMVRKVIEDSGVKLDLTQDLAATDPDALMYAVAAAPGSVSVLVDAQTINSCPFPRRASTS